MSPTPATATRPDAPSRAWIVAAIAFTAVVAFVGMGTGGREADVDQAVYEHTLREMRNGTDYYEATRDALVAKEGAPPSQLRSVRPPLEFAVLARLPESTWRLAAAVAFGATIALAGALAQPFGRWAGPVAVTGAGLWSLGYMPLLYLHAEIWAAPWLLAGLLYLRRRRPGPAIGALATAVAFRELYAMPLLVAAATHRRRKATWFALVALASYAIAHAVRAAGIIEAGGRETPFGNFHLGASYVLTAVSPSDRPLGWLIGVGFGVCGVAGALRWRRRDPAARAAVAHVALMVPLTWLAGRSYWGFTFGPLLAAYAPAAFARRPADGGSDRFDLFGRDREQSTEGDEEHELLPHAGEASGLSPK